MSPVNKYGPLAQLVEHLTFNQVVAGSIPARPTINLLRNNALVSFLFGADYRALLQKRRFLQFVPLRTIVI